MNNKEINFRKWEVSLGSSGVASVIKGKTIIHDVYVLFISRLPGRCDPQVHQPVIVTLLTMYIACIQLKLAEHLSVAFICLFVFK